MTAVCGHTSLARCAHDSEGSHLVHDLRNAGAVVVVQTVDGGDKDGLDEVRGLRSRAGIRASEAG